MRPSQIALILSLAANAGLVATLLLLPANREHGSRAAAPLTSAAQGRASSAVPAADGNGDRSRAGEERREVASRRGMSWAALRSDDLSTVAARLRESGFPPHVQRAIVTTLVDQRFGARREALMATAVDSPYWQPQPNVLSDPEKRAAWQQLNRERNDLLKQLLGSSGTADDPIAQVYQRRQFGDLAPEKIAQLQDLVGEYGELRSQVAPRSQAMTPEDTRILAAVEQEFRADLAAVLTPYELEQYDLRSSPTAQQLRHRLDTFAPSEAEYRSIFQLQRTVDEQFPAGVPLNPQQQAARRAAEAQIQAQLQATLGPERYADYQQATDPKHATLNQLVARLDLPLSAARDVVAVQQSINRRAQEILTSDTLTSEQQTEQLQALSREATAKLTTTLGPRGLQIYRDHGGQWLQNLDRPPLR